MYYFAYGSNLSKKQMQERCPGSKPVTVATLPNYKLVFTGWSRKWMGGVATVRHSRGDKVRGGLYEVTEACLRQLDKHEAGYSRMSITVFDEDSDAREAVTYVKSGQIEETSPSQKYGETIRQGYMDWGLL